MREIKLKNWEELEDNIQRIYSENKKLQIASKRYYSEILFRGQANFEWQLQTTLERYTPERYSVGAYNSLIASIKNNIESFTNASWSLEEYNVERSKNIFYCPPNYEFMAYLRHFGFPSPLLDWTRSPYVAAYFAFDSADKQKSDFVSIYCFQEWCGNGKSWADSDPRISNLGPNIKTHKRHYIQQSEYTVCRKFNRTSKDYDYYPHEEAFKENKQIFDGHIQDSIFRFILPVSERSKVLNKLDLMNINSYTLFDNEEALMNVLARKNI
jgi:hypothetical protein